MNKQLSLYIQALLLSLGLAWLPSQAALAQDSNDSSTDAAEDSASNSSESSDSEDDSDDSESDDEEESDDSGADSDSDASDDDDSASDDSDDDSVSDDSRRSNRGRIVRNGRLGYKGNLKTKQHIYYEGDTLDISVKFERGRDLLAAGEAEAHIIIIDTEGGLRSLPTGEIGAGFKRFFRIESVSTESLAAGQYQLGLVLTVPGGDPTLLSDWYSGFRGLLDVESVYVSDTSLPGDDDLDGEWDDDSDGDGIEGEEDDDSDDDSGADSDSDDDADDSDSSSDDSDAGAST